MSDTVTSAIAIAKGGAELLGVVVKLIDQAINGDGRALAKLKRVEQVLSPTSPTESAFARADDIAAGKPPRGGGGSP